MGEVKDAVGIVDSGFNKIENYITDSINRFVAFLFFLFSAGMFFGIILANKKPETAFFLLLLPPILGLVAYYNKAFSLALFIGLIAFTFIL
jgi:hypothetical protein